MTLYSKLLSLLLACTFSFNTSDKTGIIKPGLVSIDGVITDYKKIYKTGKLTYFDAITRRINDKIFEIDSTGKFSLEFDLAHPIIGSIYFDLENTYYPKFFVEPNTFSEIIFEKDSLMFKTDGSGINREISRFYKSLNAGLGSLLEESRMLHNQGLSVEEYLIRIKNIEKTKLEFLSKYESKNQLAPKTLRLLESEIKFETAHGWVNYRYNYTENSRRIRDTLPPMFFENLVNQYPIKNPEDFQTRIGIDYISNLVSVYKEKGSNPSKLLSYFQTSGQFTNDEIKVIGKALEGDRAAGKSLNSTKQDLLNHLSIRFSLNNLMENLELIPAGLLRDLILTQGLSKIYFENNIQPTAKEWEKLQELISEESLFNYISSQSGSTTIPADPNPQVIIGTTSLEEVKSKFLTKYSGKVIYIDFYATWCGPCREEIPYAKALHKEFTGDDVVFVNLCASSKQADWENLIKQKEIGGENYLLSPTEYRVLAELYGVKGFPTYVLIDKTGRTANLNAPRPSSKSEIINEIKSLLQ
ncbi:MAG TPA: hypothetical protein DC042_08220 [Bacteroidales bacterium]|nr:hypothetical protein [Bacteroidales bacterium]